MSNKLPWFTHDHNARNDDFLQRAEDRFGPFGYSAWFKIIEVLHEHGTGDILKITKSRLSRELRSRWPQVELYLNFSQTSGKLQFNSSSTEVQLQIKKFRERQSKMKSNLLSTFRQPSGNLPLDIEEEGDRDKEKTITAPNGAEVSKPLTPIQVLVRSYKISKGIDKNDKEWDKANFSIHARAAKKLLEAFNGKDQEAVVYLASKAYDFKEKELEYNLATIARHAWDDRGRNNVETESGSDRSIPGELGSKEKPLGSDSILERGQYPKITQAGKVAAETLRSIGSNVNRHSLDGEYKLDGESDAFLAEEH